jgi:hypothetical protein
MLVACGLDALFAVLPRTAATASITGAKAPHTDMPAGGESIYILSWASSLRTSARALEVC